MLLALRPPTRSARIVPSVGASAPSTLRADQGSVVEVPNAPRPRGDRAVQRDFGSVSNVGEAEFPLFWRYPNPPPYSRLARPIFSGYPDIHGKFEYPSVVTTQNAVRPTTQAAMSRVGGYATQTDFGIRRLKAARGPRSNGLLLGLPMSTRSRVLRAAETYLQEQGFAVVWAASFPTQFAGLRYFKGTVFELCLVAVGDAPAGAQWRVQKSGTTYAVYLVDAADPNASHIRVQTPAGMKAARLKT